MFSLQTLKLRSHPRGGWGLFDERACTSGHSASSPANLLLCQKAVASFKDIYDMGQGMRKRASGWDQVFSEKRRFKLLEEKKEFLLRR